MTKKEIAGQLQEKRAALAALLEKNNLSLEAVLSAQQLTIVQQVDAVLGIAEAPQDIGKKAFVEYVQDWVTGIKSTLSTCDRTDIEVSVLDAKTSFVGYIHNVKFPISAKLWKSYLKPALDNLGELATPKAIAEAMTGALEEFEQYMQNKFEQTEHFKKNKATYAKIKKKQLEGVLMTADEFNTWLNKAIAEGKELEEKQETSNEKFNESLEKWAKETRNSVETLLTDSIKQHIVDKKEFLSKLQSDFTKEYKLTYPELTELISKTLEDVVSGADILTVKEIASGFSDAAAKANTYVRKHKAEIQAIYKKHASLPSFQVIQNVILESKAEIEANDLNVFYWNWKRSISSTIEQVAMDKGWSTGQLLKTKKLVDNFKAAFTGGTDPNSAFLYEVFKEKFEGTKKELMTYQEFETVWPKAIEALDQKISTHTQELLLKYSGQEIKQIIQSVDLPDSTRLASAVFNSRYYKARPKSTTGDTIGVQFIFNDATQLLVNLAPTTKAVGQGVGITLGNLSSLVQKNGSNGYAFKVDSLQQSDPQYNSSDKSTITKFSFNIQADKSRGSSTKGKGTIKGSTSNTEGGYEYTRGREDATIKGTNTAHTTGENTETTDQTDVVHTDNVTHHQTEENYKENSDSYGVDASINTPIGGVGVNYNKTYTDGKSNSENTTTVDETVTTSTHKTVTNEINTTTEEEVDLVEEKTISSHSFSVTKGYTTYDQKTTSDSKNVEHGISSGGTQITMELHSVYDVEKKTVTVSFKNVELTSVTLDKIKLTNINTTPAPLVISVK